MTPSRPPILPLAFEHLILASFRKIKTNLAAASSPAARQTSPRFGDKANPLSFEGLLDFHDGGEIALSYPLPPVQFREASHHDPGDGLGEHLMVSARHAEPPISPPGSLSRKRIPAFSKADWIYIRVRDITNHWAFLALDPPDSAQLLFYFDCFVR